MLDDFDVESKDCRLLPIGGGGNAIVSRRSYRKEMIFRRERNKEIGENAFDIPKWEDLKRYPNA